MSLCVVAIHINPLANCRNQTILALYSTITKLAVPFFFLSSGFLMTYNLNYPYKDQKSIEKIKHTLCKMVKLYFFWSLIYLPLTIMDDISRKISFREAWHDYLQGFLFIGGHAHSYMLWYVLSSIYSLIFILLLLKYTRMKPGHILIFGCLILMISIGLNCFAEYTGNPPFVISLLQKLLQYTILNGRILLGFFYIPIAMVLSKDSFNIKVSAALFISGFACHMCIQDTHFAEIPKAVCSIGFFSLIEKLKFPDSACFPVLREISADVYFLHLMIWFEYYTVVYGQRTYGADCFIATVLLSVLVSLLHISISSIVRKKNHI